ncbi:hypothetical protein WDW86_10130 [Bdellovibrionota bacterium FG-2]
MKTEFRTTPLKDTRLRRIMAQTQTLLRAQLTRLNKVIIKAREADEQNQRFLEQSAMEHGYFWTRERF